MSVHHFEYLTMSGGSGYCPFSKLLLMPGGWDYEESEGKLALLLMLEGRGIGKLNGEEYKLNHIYDVLALYLKDI